ncbi:MAG: hypothetical protein JST23_01025 [Bacteroidetes bacterium]|nr:hypothetical protein [Bacteroidota bacterium]
MPTLIVNTDFKNNRSLWAPSNIAAFLLMSIIKINIEKDQNIHLYIDGKEAAAFETNEKVEIAVSTGTHTIQAKYQSQSTIEYSFDFGENEHAKKIFCVGNYTFHNKWNIVVGLCISFMFLILMLIIFYSKLNIGYVFLPVLGMIGYYIYALNNNLIIDITEMWSEYV